MLGLAAGLLLTPLLTRNITRYIGTVSGPATWLVPVAAAVVVLALLVLFVVALLRRFDRVSPVEALRSGAITPTRRGRRRFLRPRLHRSRAPVHHRLAVIDLIVRARSYVLLLVVFAVSAFIAIVPVNSATTVTEPGVHHLHGHRPRRRAPGPAAYE